MSSIRGELDAVRLSWFARMWGVMAWFHLAAEPRGALETQPWLAALSLGVAATATLTVIKPTDRRWLLALCALIPLHALAEAPVVGNHWVLASLISLAFCLNALRRKRKADWEDFLPAARLTLLVAYSFAAFAKVNWDFINPAVSCVVLFQDRLVNSLGLGALSVAGHPEAGQVLSWLTVLIELAIALSLAFPKTRRAGLVLAFGFHGVLAFDLAQHFWDFSSVLFAGFLLFLDDAQVAWLGQKFGELFAGLTLKPVLWGTLFSVLGLLIGVLNVLPLGLGYRDTIGQLGHSLWWIYGPTLIGIVAACFFALRGQGQASHATLLPPALLWLTPALALLNGLTPYLEVKTGFGWNMYSNLRTVAGQTNHLLVPRTWDLRGAQRELVHIVSSPDANLQRLHDQNYALTYSEFRNYAHRFPDSGATYEWRGQIHKAARLGDDPAGQGALNILALKLLPFRAVDMQTPERCQPSFSPAR